MLPLEIPNRPFTWSQLKTTGVRKSHLQHWLDTGRVRRVMRNVYAPSELPDNLVTRAQASTLVINQFSVVCDRTAAWIWDIDTLQYRELDFLPPLETFVLRGFYPTSRRECHGGQRDLEPSDICEVEGLRVTTPLRTALDLGCKLRRRRALAALDSFMRQYGITREQMLAELPRYRRRRGVVQLRELILLADPRAESPGESFTRMEIIDAGLPIPELQLWVKESGRDVFRVDLAYPKSWVIVEYDGRDFHDGDEQREADRLRRKWLRDRGWKVIVVRKEDLHGDALAAWISELRKALQMAV